MDYIGPKISITADERGCSDLGEFGSVWSRGNSAVPKGQLSLLK